MAVAIGTATTATLAVGATTTFSFTSTNQPLYLGIARWRNLQTISGVTFSGTALTRVAQTSPSNGDDAVEIWRLLAPAAGTANLVLSHAGGSGGSGSVGALNTTGQDTGGTPEGTAVTNTSSVNAAATGSLSVAGMASGDLVLVVVANGAGAAITPANTGGSGLTEIYDLTAGGEESESFRVSDACTAVSASWTGSTGWAIAAIPLKATAGAADPFPAGYRLGRQQPPNRLTLLAR